mmetsp:Transcript_37544/g.98615  ORF Transcript_37544/g.98615 Transcript_37544/m.98615 type:complete len:81 (+) Transcript_37544:390-632(+)
MTAASVGHNRGRSRPALCMLHSFKMVERRMITRRKISVGDSEYILATSTIFGTCPVIHKFASPRNTSTMSIAMANTKKNR